MDEDQRQQFQQTADRATVFCLLSFAIAAYIIWANIDQDPPRTASTTLPMVVVGIVHLLGGGIALFHAVKTKNIARNIPVYGYFLLILLLAITVIGNRGIFL